jgi:hypothetical protein
MVFAALLSDFCGVPDRAPRWGSEQSSSTGKKPGWWGALFAGGDDGEIGDLGEWDGDRIMAAGHGQPDLPAVS